MVYVKGGAHLALLSQDPVLGVIPGTLSTLTELGLCSEQIKITPNHNHHDINIDNYGPKVPVDVMAQMRDCTIEMTFVHFDDYVLAVCMAESAGGLNFGVDPIFGNINASWNGIAGNAGQLLGGGKDYFASGNHFISLSLLPINYFAAAFPPGAMMRFPTCYITDRVVYPIGTERSLVSVTWRSIPYRPYLSGSDYPSMSGLLFDDLIDDTP